MNYLPDLDKVRLKDTWVFIEGEEIHLFYLAETPQDPCKGRLFGHAVSTDWLHWRTLEPIDPKGTGDDWDAGTPGTGHVFKYDDGRYYMAYTGRCGEGAKQVEHISVMVSEDLHHWEKIARHPIWPCPSQSPYETNKTVPRAAWRDPVIVKNPKGQWQAFCAARLDHGSLSGRGCVARATIHSPTHWQTLPPLEQPHIYSVMEVPEMFELDGKVWMLFSTGGCWWGQQIHTSSRHDIFGTFYLVADQWDGPFRQPSDNLLIGSGSGRIDAYVARIVRYKDQALCYHHYHHHLRALGIPKVIASDGERLYLKPWTGLEKLYQGEASIQNWRELPPSFKGLSSTGQWDFADSVITGRSSCGGAILYAPSVAEDIDLSLRINLCAASGGIVMAMSENHGLAFVMDASLGALKVGFFRGMGAYGPIIDVPLDKVFYPVQQNCNYEVRIIQRERFWEVFVDNRLQFSMAIKWYDRADGLGLYVENGQISVHFDAAHRLEPLRVTPHKPAE